MNIMWLGVLMIVTTWRSVMAPAASATAAPPPPPPLPPPTPSMSSSTWEEAVARGSWLQPAAQWLSPQMSALVSGDYDIGSGLYSSLPGSSPTCIQQSATDGYFRNEDCRQMNLFVCEVDKNVAFTQPPEGTGLIICTTIFKYLE